MKRNSIDEQIHKQEESLKLEVNLRNAKEKYNNIVVPKRLCYDKEVIFKNKKNRIAHLRPVSISIFFVGMIVLFINISPVLAAYIEKLPLLAPLVELIRFDKGLEKAVENDFVQSINKSVEDKGIKVTINNVVFDRRRMIVDYSFETKDNYEDMWLYKTEFTDINGEQLKAVTVYENAPDEEFKIKKSRREKVEISFSDDTKTFPEEIRVKILSFHYGDVNRKNEQTIEGNWNFDIKLDQALLNAEPKIVKVDKEVNKEAIKFVVDDLRIYPTMVDVKVSVDESSKYKIAGFKKPRLVDDRGQIYTSISFSGSIMSDLEYIIHFQSNYFTNFKSVTFEADGVYYMPREEQFIELDLKNKTILSSEDYMLEIDSISVEKSEPENREDLKISLKVSDDNFFKELNKDSSYGVAYVQFNDAYDENGNKYSTTFSGHFSRGMDNISEQMLYIGIKDIKDLPDKLKIKVSTSNKDLTSTFSVKLE